ncbi:hypothetical protein H2200_006606 [Cladophialophora chaetospira]|uniref:DUF7923 domain-containing protein n=1 Tax=Cladophialophora chaetospira TaxID=386627 RepID=A0AA39CHU7_9EURO|nr:hypothetical protein H2200_006606 [Cladophialophora chaetospira]
MSAFIGGINGDPATTMPYGDLHHEQYFDLEQARQNELDYYRNRCFELERQKKEVSLGACVGRKFAVVLVDGDGFFFQKSFFENFSSGGSWAANELYQAVLRNLREGGDIDLDCDVLVNVYASKPGLYKTLLEAGYVEDRLHFDRFFQTFNQSRSLFQFIDCGMGKERVDVKLRDTLHFYSYNAQCQRILVACSHDSGYIAQLERYTYEQVAAKIVLVHGWQSPVTAWQYDQTVFKSTRFDTVFEALPLLSSVGSPTFDPVAPALSDAHETNPENEGHVLIPTVSMASSLSNSNTFDPEAPPFKIETSPVAKEAGTSLSQQRQSGVDRQRLDRTNGIPVNRTGQRVDLRIPTPNHVEQGRFHDRTGSVPCNNAECIFKTKDLHIMDMELAKFVAPS